MERIWRRGVTVPALAALAVGLAACGSSNDSGSSESQPGSTKAVMSSVPEPITSPPTKIPISAPMKAPAPKGKTFFWLQCEVPICAKITTGVKAATTAMGWNLKTMTFKATAPGAGIESALQEKPDVIGVVGIPSAAVKPQLAAAAKAGIPVLACGGPEQPSPTTYSAICGNTTEPDGEQMARWAIRESGGAAHMVTVTIGDYPSLATTVNGISKTAKKYCPECSTDVLNVTIDDLGQGQVASKLVAYLQTHPDVNYVLYTFADLQAGLPEALKAAGFADKVTAVGNGAAEAQFRALAGGAKEAWLAYPAVLEGWLLLDAAARLVSDGKLPDGYQKQLDHLPTYVVDTAAAANALAPLYDWHGPANYEEQFKKLWKVG
jgi:ABC-type sugar transport system substrate-binding protein